MTKRAFREQFVEFRKTIGPDEIVAISDLIQTSIRDFRLWDKISSALLYLPKTNSNEINLSDLVEDLRRRGVLIALPVVTFFGASFVDGPRIKARNYEGPESLTLNKWGIPEPVEGALVDVGTIDIAIVPALGAGRNKYRIGHGFGYYDELLSTALCPKICPVPSGCLADSVPFEDHDVPVDYIVTEVETIGDSDAL